LLQSAPRSAARRQRSSRSAPLPDTRSNPPSDPSQFVSSHPSSSAVAVTAILSQSVSRPGVSSGWWRYDKDDETGRAVREPRACCARNLRSPHGVPGEAWPIQRKIQRGPPSSEITFAGAHPKKAWLDLTIRTKGAAEKLAHPRPATGFQKPLASGREIGGAERNRCAGNEKPISSPATKSASAAGSAHRPKHRFQGDVHHDFDGQTPKRAISCVARGGGFGLARIWGCKIRCPQVQPLLVAPLRKSDTASRTCAATSAPLRL